MSRLRKRVIRVVAAATIAAASLAATPPASAMPMSCNVRQALSYIYMGTGIAFAEAGDQLRAAYWFGKADGIMVGC